MNENNIPKEIATLAGGCFWCTEAGFDALQGVENVQSGYMGGDVPHPTYEAVCRGDSGHAEVVQITFNPQQIRYLDLLEVFFTLHDPTTLNRQGNDVGRQYRSAIFWHTDAQRKAAEEAISSLAKSGKFAAPIVTEITAAMTFWAAEPDHVDYYRRHPNQPYCRFVIAPKLTKIRGHFSAQLKRG